MRKAIVSSFCGLVLMVSLLSPHITRAETQTYQELISVLQALIIKLQAQLAEMQKVQTPPTTSGSENRKRFDFGPRSNAMACDRTGIKLSNGELACLGLHDYGNEFGEDQNTCGGLNPDYDKKNPLGCVIPAPICKSGKAIAADFYSPSSRTASQVQTLAKQFKTTELAVKTQLVNLWEYRCTASALTSFDSESVYVADPSAGFGIHPDVEYSKKDWSFVKRPSQVVIAGVYQGELLNETDQYGEVKVSLDYIESDTLLVLSAYEPVEWNLSGLHLKNVKAIYLTGYNDQRVVGAPAGVKITRDIYQDGSDAFFIVYNGKGEEDDDFYELRSYIHEVTNQKANLYFGGYETSVIKASLKG